jgi:hypothetical protein
LIASELTRLAGLFLALIRKSKFYKTALGARNNVAIMEKILNSIALAIMAILGFIMEFIEGAF